MVRYIYIFLGSAICMASGNIVWRTTNSTELTMLWVGSICCCFGVVGSLFPVFCLFCRLNVFVLSNFSGMFEH